METSSNLELGKTKLFSQFALSNFGIIKMYQESGILGKGNEGWRNISEHCLTVAMAGDILAEATNADRERTVKAALLHDWYKRREVEAMKEFGGDVGHRKAMEEDEKLLKEAGISKDLIHLAHSNIPETEDLAKNRQRSKEEKIMHYIDLITDGSNFVGFKEKLDLARTKPKVVEFCDSYRSKYNGKSLLDVQEEVGADEEVELADMCGVEGDRLIDFINQKLQDRINKAA